MFAMANIADGMSRARVLCFGVEEGARVNIEGGDYHAGISEKYHEADGRRDHVTRCITGSHVMRTI